MTASDPACVSAHGQRRAAQGMSVMLGKFDNAEIHPGSIDACPQMFTWTTSVRFRLPCAHREPLPADK